MDRCDKAYMIIGWVGFFVITLVAIDLAIQLEERPPPRYSALVCSDFNVQHMNGSIVLTMEK